MNPLDYTAFRFKCLELTKEYSGNLDKWIAAAQKLFEFSIGTKPAPPVVTRSKKSQRQP